MKTIEKIKIMLEAPSRTLIDAYRTFLKEMLEECEKYRWHDLRKNPDDLPKAETKVDVVCIRNGMQIRTHGFYEDGTVHTEDSDWRWDEICFYGDYCEETDDYIIPEGWWEYNLYLVDEQYNNVIDDKVIAWREIQPWEEEEQ